MWHVSVSTWSGARGELKTKDTFQASREAVRALRGVGGDCEWWLYNAAVGVGHLRVPLTAEEIDRLPAGGVPVHDAGPTGPKRARTA